MLLVIGVIVGVIGLFTLPDGPSGWLGLGAWMLFWLVVVRREYVQRRDAAELAADAAAAAD